MEEQQQEKSPEKIDQVYDAVKELTTQLAELAKQLKEFKESYQKHQKAGKF